MHTGLDFRLFDDNVASVSVAEQLMRGVAEQWVVCTEKVQHIGFNA